MILSVLLSATFTFSATATGVEKGTTLEFVFAGPHSDRDYESLFLLDEPVDAFCSRLEAFVPRGEPVNAKTCHLWPTGCTVRFDPPLDRFVSIKAEDGERSPVPIYTGGTRKPDGTPDASDVMPSAVFATYSLPQSPIVFNEPRDQGSAYGSFTVARTLEKGKKFTFTISIDEKTLPRKIVLTAEKGALPQLLNRLRTESSTGEVDAIVSLSDDLTVSEAISTAQALAVVDSSRVKINGLLGLFYRAFLPLEKWRDRQERLHQPFELTLRDDGTDELLFIDEDWSVEGPDPKLTPRKISFSQASLYDKTDTCFIYASVTQTISRVSAAMKKLSSEHIVNWYVFPKD